MLFCPSSPAVWSDGCVREVWSALVPAGLVAIFLLVALLRVPFPAVNSPLAPFFRLEEAEQLDSDEDKKAAEVQVPRPTRWFTLVIVTLGLVQTAVWLALGAYLLVVDSSNRQGILPFFFAFTWLYAVLKPSLKSSVAPPYDLFTLYIFHLVGALLMLGGVLYDHSSYGDPLPPRLHFATLILNTVVSLLLVALVFSRPLALPSSRIAPAEIGRRLSPEDYTSLWGWASFNWVNPLVNKGTRETLNEDDVWELSATMRARPLFRKFSTVRANSLLWQLIKANSQDIILDFVGTIISVFFNYCGPFFLKRIIDVIDSRNQEPAALARAYIFAFLMFASQVLKAQADVQHLWYGRRVSVRVRSQLMSKIYDKALKRKDFSGIVGHTDEKKDEKEDGKSKKKDKSKSDDEPKAGADVGKIVNLMAGDSTRISMIMSGMYFIYGAPFEVVFASLFLYDLMGWSAFSGFLVFLIGAPLNTIITRRSIRIQKGVLAARDKRMDLLNELLGSLKFIKFFAWEERWVERVLDSRAVEMSWLARSRVNTVLLQILWNTAPIGVSIISFLTFVAQGNKLTVGTAFTAIALFNMIRQPLNTVPTWLVQVLQTRVALKRIEKFLDEDEVDGQVSSLKEDVDVGPLRKDLGPETFGLKNASFKWNAILKEDSENKAKDGKSGKGKKSGSGAEADLEAALREALPSTESEETVFELRDINVTFPEGLTVVTGPTASGKTALLLSLLGEMTKTSGEILMSKDPSRIVSPENGLTQSISYAAQTPWLQHQSIKANILFGSPFDAARYAEVLDACALRPDLKILEDGDETEIGARGVSLSGGQKARVALARAVYARTKYVLLDDPLSAVDSHTSRYLFENLFMGPLMRDRTVVLVTHHVELVLPGAYYLVRMLDGRIDLQGTVKELRESGALADIEVEGFVEERKEVEQKVEKAVEASETLEGENTNEPGTKKPRKLIKDEEREAGSVKWKIYNTYLKASSYWTWAVLVFLVICSQSLSFIEKYWIKVWGEAYGSVSASVMNMLSSNAIIEQQSQLVDSAVGPHHFTNVYHVFTTTGLEDRLPPATEHPLFYVAIYALIGIVTVIVSVSSSAITYSGALYASRRLFKGLLNSVMHATMRWFDVTPTGRIMNRFQKDIETIDGTLAGSMQLVNSSLASFFTSMIVVVAVFPPFVIPGIIIGYVYYVFGIAYLNTGRDLRRMESTTRSPIFSGFGELLEGIVTVRAFSAEHRFMNNLYTKIDVTLRMFYFFWMTNRWLLLRYDCLGAFAVFVTTLFALITSGNDKEQFAGWAALTITSAMSFTSNIYWSCRFWTQLELDLNSVERIVEYLDLPQEPPATIENARPPAHWPSSSGPNENQLLEVRNLQIKYAPDLPAVLHDVSFKLKARERVGLLGRTGSGKSTLAMSILRFVDPAQGQILIDGIDITSIGVQDLRSRLTFIPQDATLFSGTIRDNLDPFGDYSDEECWDALYRVQMMSHSEHESHISSRAPSIHGVRREETDATAVAGDSSLSADLSPSRVPSEATTVAGDGVSTSATANGSIKITLSTEVSAGGLNFSAGQRQLLAMARALLRQSAVVVLDEATSSIDFATDFKIQQTIREEFGNSLLLTVAHRLRTVIDYDRLLVLDAGRVVEFDTPYNLIQKKDGIFRGMCMKSGSFSELESAARAKTEKDGVLVNVTTPSGSDSR